MNKPDKCWKHETGSNHNVIKANKMTNVNNTSENVLHQFKNGNSRKTTEQFIKEARNVHGDRYCYDFVEYKTRKASVDILCPKHGVFSQLPRYHLQGRKCRKCSLEDLNSKGRSSFLGKEEYIKRAIEKHGENYDYTKVDYTGRRSKICINCRIHGDFYQRADYHLSGKGCPYCSGNKLNLEFFISKARKVHLDKYDYSQTKYHGTYSKVIIVCREHGSFNQSPTTHLKGGGCPKCTLGLSSYVKEHYLKLSKRNDSKATLYIIQCKNEEESFFKVGITFRALGRRFSPSMMPYKYQLVKSHSNDADFIWSLEKRLHVILKKYKYQPKIDFKGKTECYSDMPSSIIELINNLNSTHQLQLIA